MASRLSAVNRQSAPEPVDTAAPDDNVKTHVYYEQMINPMQERLQQMLLDVSQPSPDAGPYAGWEHDIISDISVATQSAPHLYRPKNFEIKEGYIFTNSKYQRFVE